MVNKGSFFQRLKGRWGSGSGVRFDEATGIAGPERPVAGTSKGSVAGRAGAGTSPADAIAGDPVQGQRVRGERAASVPSAGSSDSPVAAAFQPVETRSSRKMSEREEAMVAVGQHFQELSQLLRGAQAASDEKLQKIVEATSSIPALGQQQLEALGALSAQMNQQNELGVQLSSTMTRLPELLENVERALDRAAKTDERTAATVLEFQSTMDRIHSSMDQMVSNSNHQAEVAKQLAERSQQNFESLAENVTSAQQGAVEELKRTNEESLRSLRRTHEDQSNRLQRVIQESTSWNRAVLVGIGLVVLGVGAGIVLQLVG